MGLAKGFVESKFMGRFRPLFISMAVTDRCNYRCERCRLGLGTIGDMDMAAAESVVRKAAAAGAHKINLTGGEPLLHPRVGEIIGMCAQAGLRVSMSTNGALLADKPGILKGLTGVSLSLDGTPATHDAMRPGGHAAVLHALEVLRESNTRAKLSCVLGKKTTEADVDEVLRAAGEYGAIAGFQPERAYAVGSREPSPGGPDAAVLVRLVEYIKKRKQRAPRLILNSMIGLNHLAQWPADARIPCGAGRFFCRIDPAGRVYSCNSRLDMPPLGDINTDDLLSMFENYAPPPCRQCWCADTVEANFMFGLKPGAIINYMQSRKGYD